MKWVIVFLFALSVLPLYSCSRLVPATPSQRPEDFRVLYQWYEGSMPPPYYYQYSIELDATGTAWVTLTPDYPSPNVPSFTENFTVSEQQLDDLFQLMQEQGMMQRTWRTDSDPPVGGSSEALTVTAGGQQYLIPSYPVSNQRQAAGEIISAVKALVPQEIWERLDGLREDYVQENE
jgi:hypothetical protein